MNTALDLLQDFIKETAPLDVIEERALQLVGEPRDKIENGIAVFCEELATCFAQEALSETFATAFTIAAAAMVRDRIAEMEFLGSGRA